MKIRTKMLSVTVGLFVAVAGLLLGGLSFNKEYAEEENESEERYDMPNAEARYDSIMTVDRVLGLIPRERLADANRYIDKWFNWEQTYQAPPIGPPLPNAITGTDKWIEMGPKDVGGRTRALWVDLNSSAKVWAGGISGGLWWVQNLGTASGAAVGWQRAKGVADNLMVSAIAQDPVNKQYMYAGTGEGWFPAANSQLQGGGIYASSNGGATWQRLEHTKTEVNGQNHFRYIQKIVVATNGDIFIATRDAGIMKSTNHGDTWNTVLGAKPDLSYIIYNDANACDLEIVGSTIYAAFGIFTDGKVFKSIDGGATWTACGGLPSGGNPYQRIELAVAPSNANIVYAVAAYTVGSFSTPINGIYKSTNGGASWTVLGRPNDCSEGASLTSQAWYNLAMAVDPGDPNIVLLGALNLYKTTNGGTSWTQISGWSSACNSPLPPYPYVHPDQHAIAFARPRTQTTGATKQAYIGNDGGVYHSADVTATPIAFNGSSYGATTLTAANPNSNNGYNTTQLHTVSAYPYSSASVANNWLCLTGTQDNGTLKFTKSNFSGTTKVLAGDGGATFIDQTTPNIQVAFCASCVGSGWNRTTDGGNTFTALAPTANGENAYFMSAADYDNTNHILYSGGQSDQIIRRTSMNLATVTRTLLTISLGGKPATNIRVSPNTPTTLYVGTDAGRVYKVTNANTTPTVTDISTGLPTGFASSIAVQAGNEAHLLATYSNYGMQSIWETTNSGATWTSLDMNTPNSSLPDMPVRSIVFNPLNIDQALIATEAGIWSTNNLDGNNTVWVECNKDLLHTRVDQLLVRPSDKALFAATHGRGLWRTDAFSDIKVDFTASNTAPACFCDPLNFTALVSSTAANPITSYAWDFNSDGTTDATAANPTSVVGYGPHITLTVNGNISYTKRFYIDAGVCPISPNGCGIGSRLIAPQKVSLFESILYPTIVSDKCTIVLNIPEETTVSIAVYDIQGRLWARPMQRQPADSGEQTFTLQTDNLPVGLYVVNVETETGYQKNLKFIKY